MPNKPQTNQLLTSLKHKINKMAIKTHDKGLYGMSNELTNMGDYLDSIRDYESDKQILKIIASTIRQLNEINLKYNEIVNQSNAINSLLNQSNEQSISIES